MPGWLEWFRQQFIETFIEKDRYKLFLTGFRNTIIIAFGAVAIGIIIGIIVAVIRVQHTHTGKLRVLNMLTGAYLAVFRGTPVVVQLMILYFIVFKNVDNGVMVAMLSFGINSGAYVAEIVRAGILAVDIGQTEAGRSLGLTQTKTMFLIVLPQAIRNILPALGNEFIQLLKETSVVGYITVPDLTRAAEKVRTQTGEPYFSLIFTAIVYFVVVFGITKLLGLVERRLARGDRGQQAK